MKPRYRYNWKKKRWDMVYEIPVFTHPKLIMPVESFEYVKLVDVEIENKVTLAIAAKESARAIRAVFKRNGVKQ